MSNHAQESLQENLLALLVYKEEEGQLVLNLVDPSYFSDAYRVIAERASAYRRQYDRPPGREHIYDLMEDILGDKNNRQRGTMLRVLEALFQLSEGINSKYVLDQASIFIRKQTISQAILDSAKLINQKQEHSLTDIEELWSKLLRVDRVGFAEGMRLTAVDRLVAFLDQQYVEFNTGIPSFDRQSIVPYRGSVFLFLAATGMGKSWWLVHLGKRALMLRKRVLYVTLEMSEEEVASRFLQSLFSVSKRHAPTMVTAFDRGAHDRLTGFSLDEVTPAFAFDSTALMDELRVHMQAFGGRIDNLLIKKFPTRSLTPDGLRRYLDTVERVEKFIPDILLVDYLGLLKTDAKDHRIGLGRNFEELRGIADERNVALGTAHQISRAGAQAKVTTAADVAEDWSLIGTADRVVTYSRTMQEKRFGLARLFVDKARSDSDKFGVLVAQNYAQGQFVLDSQIMDPHYWERLKELENENKHVAGVEEDEEDDDEE